MSKNNANRNRIFWETEWGYEIYQNGNPPVQIGAGVGLTVMENHDVGTGAAGSCKNHPDRYAYIEKPESWQKIPDLDLCPSCMRNADK